METITGNLLEGDWDIAMHCANPHKVMGSGVALHLKNKWPEVEKADNDWRADPEDRLGYSTIAHIGPNRSVINLYGQVGVGCDGNPLNRNCSYDHLYNAIYRCCEAIDKFYETRPFPITIGVPYKMASDRAGGSWPIVVAIIEDIEAQFDNIEFTAYELKTTNNTKHQSSVTIP